MTRERAKELLPVIQAWAEGKDVQCKRQHQLNGPWIDNGYPAWDDNLDFRIKPEPREWWLNVYPDNDTCGPYKTKEEANMNAAQSRRIACIKVREVME